MPTGCPYRQIARTPGTAEERTGKIRATPLTWRFEINYIDFETFSATPIKHGTYRYTADCEPMICTYALGDTAPVQLWDITTGEPMPADLAYVLEDDDELLCAHSSMFDRNVMRLAMGIDIRRERWRDSMVRALAHGLPGSLDLLCDILRVSADKAKHKDGKKLIQLFCKPRPANSTIARATRLTHPAEWQRFCEYAMNDISAMREVYNKLPEWNYRGSELALWHLDQKINDRGMCVDVAFAKAAIEAVGRAQKQLKKETLANTGGAVESTTQREELLAHIMESYGVDLPNLQKDTLERRIADPDLPNDLRELLRIRLAASSTSTSKYTALVRGVSDDGRLRGTLQFDGAARTRRPAGRTFQPTNLPRPDMPQPEIEFGIEAILAGAEDLIVPDTMRLCRNAVRGAIIAPPERKIVVADLANIEGRDGAWLAGEEWKLQAFRDFDAGLGADLYALAYARAFSTTVQEVMDDKLYGTGLKRQIGKVMELMLQYGGGVGAFVTGAETYRIDLEELTRVALPLIPLHILEDARGMWRWANDPKHKARRRFTCGLREDVFVVCDSLKRLWRNQHPEIVSLWAELENAARAAILQPGNTVECRMFKLRRDGAWLRIRLPSGNFLCYTSPEVADDGSISYMGMNQYTRRWSRIGTYGGKLFENICQGFAGDILKFHWPEIEERGYNIVLTVYDENVTETPDSDEFSSEDLARIMTSDIPFAQGLPLAAAGYEAQRYRKD